MDRRNRTIVVLALALAVASAASYGVYRTVRQMPVHQVEVANYKVVVATKPLSMGARVTAADVKLVAWPSSSPVSGGHSDLQTVIDRGCCPAWLKTSP